MVCSEHTVHWFQQWKINSGRHVPDWSEVNFTTGIVSPALCFDFGPQLMDSSEKQPLKWHYFRSVHKNTVATQLLPQKWDSSVTERHCSAWSCQADQPSGNLPDNCPWWICHNLEMKLCTFESHTAEDGAQCTPPSGGLQGDTQLGCPPHGNVLSWPECRA